MKIIKNIEVPTGNILVVQGDKGLIECISLGDYGKDKNIKADFLGLSRAIDKVEHTKLLPLEEKWVITISTQYGCKIGCMFCDVPKVKFSGNATCDDLINQLLIGMKIHPEVKSTKRLNIHFARMGEPTFNPHVLEATKWFKSEIDPTFKIHPVVSTMMPKHNDWLEHFIREWMDIKNGLLNGEAGLQISINSTNEDQRRKMFHNNACTLEEISEIMRFIKPEGRKITLNFAVANYEIDPSILIRYFDPEHYLIKLTPMHKTSTAIQNGIFTKGDYTTLYPYKEHETELKKVGYDVLVFIASKEEDEGLITCGNAVLTGSRPGTKWRYIDN